MWGGGGGGGDFIMISPVLGGWGGEAGDKVCNTIQTVPGVRRYHGAVSEIDGGVSRVVVSLFLNEPELLLLQTRTSPVEI